jgi:ABC-type sugar transport system ATPase subunit
VSDTPHVELRGIRKRYGATLALDGVDLVIQAGSVHALVGENGAGKSTLGKILAGVVQPDGGTLLVHGQEVSFRSPRNALQSGISTIAQELSLVPARDVLDNVYLGIEDGRGPLVDRRAMRKRYEALVADTGLDVPPDAIVGSLPIAQQQQVEILRALAREARLVIMDEPTARLSGGEAERLHEVVRDLAARGTTIVYVSHFLEEVLALAETVTVLRDGRLVRTVAAEGQTPSSLVEAMVGRSLSATFPDRVLAPADAPELLRVEGLTRAGVFADVSFSVRAGEIVGMAGLVGAGRSEVGRAIFGADSYDSGTVVVDGRELPRGRGVRRRIRSGVAMIPESRKDQGLLLGRSVRENVSLPHLEVLSRLGVVRHGDERARALGAADAVDVKRASDDQPVISLSGGNQQKVLFARWLMERPRVLIADEPTRGVDVAAKRAIYDLLANLAAEGMGVLVISSELEEVLGLSHRVIVMKEGRIVAEMAGDEATEHDVMTAAFGADITGSAA